MTTITIKRIKNDKKTEGYYQQRRSSNLISFLLLSMPALIWYLGLIGWPLINMFYMSFLRWEGIILPSTFVGFRNYVILFTSDSHFWPAVKNTFLWLLVEVPPVILIGFALGYFLSQRRAGYRFFRFIFFLPQMVSISVLTLLFSGIYMDHGLVNSILRMIGLNQFTHLWLAEPGTALMSIIALDYWGGFGYTSVLFFSALANISTEIYDAARLDGALPWITMWEIAFPICRDFVGLIIMFQTLWVLTGTGPIIYLLTKGGPNDATLNLSYMVYQQAISPSTHLGYSQSIAVVLFFIGFLLLALIRVWARKS